jgi:hypothetical protein
MQFSVIIRVYGSKKANKQPCMKTCGAAKEYLHTFLTSIFAPAALTPEEEPSVSAG